MGVTRTARTLLKLNQVDGFDCQGCAWPDPAPGHRHPAEFCENGAKAVAEEATTEHVLPAFFEREQPRGAAPSTPTTGSVTRAGWSTRRTAPRRDALRADQLGGGLRADRGDPARAGEPRRGGLLHLGQDLQRGGVRLPALRARLRHQQPAGLLEHVPRVDLGGAGRDDRHRQGLGQPRGRPQGEADRDQRPEPGHQPPADADRAGDREAERREDPLHQPVARGRADEVQEPADAPGRQSASAPDSPTCTCRSGSTATWRCGRRSAA